MGTIVSEFNPAPGQIYDLFCAISGHYHAGNFNVYQKMIGMPADTTTEKTLAPLQGLMEQRPKGLELFFNYFKGRTPCISVLFSTAIQKYDAPEAFIEDFAAWDTDDIRCRMLAYYDSNRFGRRFYQELLQDEEKLSEYVGEMKEVHVLRFELIRFLKEPGPVMESVADIFRKALPYIKELHRIRKSEADAFAARKIAELSRNHIHFSDDPGRVLVDTDQLDELALSVSLVNIYVCFLAKRGRRVSICLGTRYEQVIGKDLCYNEGIDFNIAAKALGDELRYNIFEELNHRDMYLSEIAGLFSLPPPAVLYHLNVMVNANLVTPRAQGRRIYYSINRPYLRSVSRFVSIVFGGE